MGRTRRRDAPEDGGGGPGTSPVTRQLPATRSPLRGRGRPCAAGGGAATRAPPSRVSRTHVQQRYYLTTHAQMCGSGATASKALFLSPQGAAATGRDRACRESQINLLSHSVA